MRTPTQSRRHSVLAAHAAAMRCTPTPSEARLWRELVNGRLGVGFRRQVVVGEFIVDFVAASRMLIVEVDGGYHSRRVAADARRDHKLTCLGYHVVHVDAALVLRDVAAAVALVRVALAPARHRG